MKKIISLFVMLAVFAIPAMASTQSTFEVHKWTSVTGDWKWDSGWQNGEFETAKYQSDAIALAATSGNGYVEFENAGTPWQYQLEQHTMLGGFGTIDSKFSAWTVNDPETTPATGGYTQYAFETHNFGEFTNSHLVVFGEGAVDVSAHHAADSYVQQDAFVSVN